MRSLLTKTIAPRAALAVVVLALAASVVSGREKPNLAEEPIAPARSAAPESVPALDRTQLPSLKMEDAIAGLFAPLAAAPAPDAAQPTPRPSAPPLPFQFVARIIEGGDTKIYVMLGEDHYSVKPGLVIDRNYRVEKVTETAVTFTYLPRGTQQVLSLN